MIIRQIEQDDIKQCLDIYNYYILNTTFTFEEDKLSLESFSNRINRICENYPFLVLVKDDIVLGYAYLDEFSTRSAYKISTDLSIYLNHNFINNGYGKMLLDEIEKIARKRNIKNIISIITDENIKSIKFHEKNNYIKVGELNNIAYKFNNYLGIVYYQKSL